MKVLYLCDNKYWTKKMSRVRFHAVDAIARNEEVTLIKDGPGFENWKDAKASVKRHSPDIVFWFKPLEIEGYQEIKIPKVIAYNEMYNVAKTTEEIVKSRSDLIICHLANDIKRYEKLSKDFKFINISHCIEKSIFKDYKQKKVYDILLTGVLSESIYPLRSRFHKLIKSGAFKDFKVKVQPHPGYRIADVNSQVLDYAKELNKAKIVLSCSSKYKYALAKYSEVPACNALMIADLPNERHEFFNKFIVESSMDMSDKDLIDTVKYWVSHDQERIDRAKIGMNLTLSKYSQEDYAKRFLKAIKKLI